MEEEPVWEAGAECSRTCRDERACGSPSKVSGQVPLFVASVERGFIISMRPEKGFCEEQASILRLQDQSSLQSQQRLLTRSPQPAASPGGPGFPGSLSKPAARPGLAPHRAWEGGERRVPAEPAITHHSCSGLYGAFGRNVHVLFLLESFQRKQLP